MKVLTEKEFSYEERHQLAEWMLAGAKKHPQCKHVYYNEDYKKNEIIATCAWGAAAYGAGVDLKQESSSLEDPVIEFVRKYLGSVFEEITHRNDVLGQTREEIAAWLNNHGNLNLIK